MGLKVENKFREFELIFDEHANKPVVKVASKEVFIKYSEVVKVVEIAAVEQLKAEIEKLRTKLADWQNGAELNELYITQYDEITALKSKLAKAKESLRGLMPEVFCLYQQYTGRRIDKKDRDYCAVVTKYTKAQEILKEIGEL